jgi:hypothetical protein
MELDGDDCVRTEDGIRVPRLPDCPSMFLDRTIVIYGPSKTGKTVIAKHIMGAVENQIQQILLVAPTEPSNRSYEGFIPAPLVHYRMYLSDPANPKKDDGVKGALRFLEQVWKRQEMMAAIYTRANHPDVLSSLFGRLPKAHRKEGVQWIEDINNKREHVVDKVRKKYAKDPGRCAEKTKEANEKFKAMLSLLYKKYIALCYNDLWARDDLSEDERYTLAYLTFNPRLLLVFDDCAAQLKPFFAKEIFRLLFYQNWHSFITALITVQDDTDMPANLRKNAFLSFFTEQVVCASNFERATNKFPKPTKDLVKCIAPAVLVGNRKLAYIREDDRRQNFYFVEYPWPRARLFGSPAMRELCEEVQSQGVAMDKENPYFEKFKIG